MLSQHPGVHAVEHGTVVRPQLANVNTTSRDRADTPPPHPHTLPLQVWRMTASLWTCQGPKTA
jgi:hypothetical protein